MKVRRTQQAGWCSQPHWGRHSIPLMYATRSFHPLLERAGVPRVRFHDLQHTCATLLLAEGVHPKLVQAQLGHNQISVTLDIYSHVTAPMMTEAAARMDNILTASSRPPRTSAGNARQNPPALTKGRITSAPFAVILLSIARFLAYTPLGYCASKPCGSRF